MSLRCPSSLSQLIFPRGLPIKPHRPTLILRSRDRLKGLISSNIIKYQQTSASNIMISHPYPSLLIKNFNNSASVSTHYHTIIYFFPLREPLNARDQKLTSVDKICSKRQNVSGLQVLPGLILVSLNLSSFIHWSLKNRAVTFRNKKPP